MIQGLGALSEILPIVLYLCFIKRNRNEGVWVIFLYCILSIISESAFSFLEHKISEFYLYGTFTICEYTLFTLFLYSSLKSKNFKYFPIVGSLIFYPMVIINFINKRSATFDSLSASVEAILLIVYSILFLYEQIKDPSVIFVYYTKKFWVVIAFFLYFSSTLFLFLYAETFTNQEHKSYWYINNLFEIIKNLLFCVAFVMKKNKKPQYPIEESLYPDM